MKVNIKPPTPRRGKCEEKEAKKRKVKAEILMKS